MGIHPIVAEISNAITTTITWFAWIAGIGAVVFVFVQRMKYKHTFVRRIVTGTKTIVIQDKFKEFTDKEGTTWWKLLKARHILPKAPPDAINITSKGRMHVEAYYTEDGQYQYARDTMDQKMFTPNYALLSKPVPKHIKKWFGITITEVEAYPKFAAYSYIEDTKPLKSFDPVTTKQRLIYLNQIKKALGRKKTKWTEHIPAIVGVSAALVFLVLLLIFWEDITKPSIEALEAHNNLIDKYDKLIDRAERIIMGQQKLIPEKVPEPPPELQEQEGGGEG